jgi:hypothetical protein
MSILPPKRAVVVVRLSESDREVLVSRAIQANVALSVLVRRAIREFLHKPVGAEPRPAAGPSRYFAASDGRDGA